MGPSIKELRQRFVKRYLNMRPDLLDSADIDTELEMRRFVVTGDKSISRRRRILRDLLRQEKEEGLPEMIVPGIPEQELILCRNRVLQFHTVLTTSKVAPKYMYALLHLANRLAVLGHLSDFAGSTEAIDLLNNVCDKLDIYFKTDSADSNPDQDIVDNLFDKAEGGIVGDSVAEQEAIECLKRMGVISGELDRPNANVFRDSLIALEKELTVLRSRLSSSEPSGTSNLSTGNIETYTGTIPKTSDGACNLMIVTSQYSRPVTTPMVTTSIYTSNYLPIHTRNQNTTPYPQMLPSYSSFSQANHVTSFPPTELENSVFHSSQQIAPYINLTSNSAQSSATHSNALTSHLPPPIKPPQLPQSIGHPSQTAGVSRPYSSVAAPQPTFAFPASSAFPPASFANPFASNSTSPYAYPPERNNTVSHRSLPVSLWKIEKYNGTDRGVKLNEFLALVEQLAQSERMSKHELFDSAFHLFDGPAKSWYMSMRHPHPGRLFNWQHLILELKRNFAHPELDILLRCQIYQRRQQRNETFQEYYFAMDKLFRSMMTPMEDREKLEIMKRNLRNDYKKSLLWQPILDLPQLIHAGHIIDSSNFSMYNQVFGQDRTVNAVTLNNNPTPNPDNSRSTRSTRNQNDNWKNPARKSSNDNPRPTNSYRDARNAPGPKSISPREPEPGPSQSRRPIDYLVEGIRDHSLSLLPKKRQADDRKSPNVGRIRVRVPGFELSSLDYEPVLSEWYSGRANTNTTEVLQITFPTSFDNRPYAWVYVHDLRVKGLLDSVIKDLLVECLLGMTFWSKFKIYPQIRQCALLQEESDIESTAPECMLTPTEAQDLEKIKLMFQIAKPGYLPTTPVTQHIIEITDEWKSKPPVRQYPYTMSPKTREKVVAELDRMLKVGIIERCQSDWSLPVVPVIKPSGKVRLCLDARKLNERTVRDAYPLPHPGRILGQLPKASYLSTIDLSEAFLQIPLEERSRNYTAFSIQGSGMYRFTRCPFGLANSPSRLARTMDLVLVNGELEPFVFVYLDDIVVVSETFGHHLQLLAEVAKRLRDANLSINLDKSHFGVNELPFLGYLLSTNGLRANPEKIKPIVEYERPTTVTKLRRFLGMANYYRRFIQDFSGATAPLMDLLKTKAKTISWTDQAEEAFCAIKEKLISSPILVSPNFSKEFTIQTDASDVAVAGVLTQVLDEQERVIAYFSHKLSTPQRNYHACEKETLAAILSIEAFRGYIEGSHFTIVTDSSALTHILRTKWKTSSRCSRWSLSLQQYNMTIRHRKGKDNVVADALSRCVAVVTAAPTSEWYDDLIKKVSDQPDNYVDFQVMDGALYKFVSTPIQPYDHRFEWKLVIPPERRNAVLKECHDDLMHIGTDKTMAKVRLKYYWPKMAKDVREYIQACSLCKETKPACIPVVPSMGEQRMVTHPWQIIAVDYIGPLPRSKRGNQHLLVVTDLFSKWCILIPVKKINSTTLCTHLRDQWFFRFSTPESLISDNASVFLSREFKNFLEQFGVRHWLSSKYHSQANPVERVNRTINAAIRTYVREDQRLWDSRTSEIETVLNTTRHSATEFTPYFVIHGHEAFAKGSDHQWFGSNDVTIPDQRTEHQKELFDQIYDLVKTNLTKAHESAKHRYNLRHRRSAKPFEVGQLVYKRNTKQPSAAEGYNAKYGPVYLPARIKKRIGTSSYELEGTDASLSYHVSSNLFLAAPPIMGRASRGTSASAGSFSVSEDSNDVMDPNVRNHCTN
ncbi:uncharacterized protein LOC129737664 [Uranotaenia lowii]|uniref:uncharacterized protein LOC129737664 n=1 Tax=Uranotaenia lowii TaxID=190385 RepID=UPI00247A6660|nr:uncharacterized protein LOC129737664 [Uranotaenia lowii]